MRTERETRLSEELESYRVNVMTHLKYIREKVDSNHDHLEKVNGRVRNNEVTLSWIKGIGSTITFIISCILGFLIKD